MGRFIVMHDHAELYYESSHISQMIDVKQNNGAIVPWILHFHSPLYVRADVDIGESHADV